MWSWWGVLTGAFGGAIGYTWYWLNTPTSWNWKSFTQHVAGGAVAGTLEPTPIAVATSLGLIEDTTEAIGYNAFNW